MENIKILIVEDEVLIAEDIKDALISFGATKIEMAHDKDEALSKLKLFAPNIALLDIRMHGNRDGLELAQYIKTENTIPYIFITSHSDVEMIKEIVKTDPAGYITKPFKKSDLYANLTIAIKYYEKDNKIIKIKEGYETHVVKLNDINYIRSEGNYIDIFYTNNQRLTCRKSLESIFKELNSDNFFKINKSHIINLQKITSFNTKEVNINGTDILVSRTVLDDFLKLAETKPIG